jgi:hypothetical protein
VHVPYGGLFLTLHDLAQLLLGILRNPIIFVTLAFSFCVLDSPS